VLKKKISSLISVVIVLLIVSACQSSDPETIIKTVIVEKEGKTVVETVVVTLEPTEVIDVEVEEVECCEVFRIGIYEEPVSLNYWNYLGPGSSVWTRYVISNDAAHLFELSDRNFQFIPSLAVEIPTPVVNSDGVWEITVDMVEDALWSDGEPITAQDVVFTHNFCKDLKLTWYWPSLCAPDGADVAVEAVSDYSVKYTYLDQIPNLRNWQFGVAMAPILPYHFWEEFGTSAMEVIDAVKQPTFGRPENCETTGLTNELKELCDVWAMYDDAYESAREILFEAEVRDYPVAGGYYVKEWLPDESIQLVPNEHYYFKGSETFEFDDGTWMRLMPDGRETKLYGEASGEELVHFFDGPFNPEIVFSIYGSQEAAFGALMAGDVDYVLNPIGIPRELRDQILENEEITTYNNADYNMFYLAFNMRSYPMSEYEFRQAFDIIIDRELVISEILGEVVIPIYSTMPETNVFWYNPNVPREYLELTRAERVKLAVSVLKNAGWRWQSEPFWDEFVQDIVPGEGLIMPNGEPMPELTILGPGPDFDIVRATFNQWVSEWARELGMPVQSELTGRNAILDSVFVASDYDMYIFGGTLGNPAYPGYFEEFWHSRNCTFETGGRNTACFKNDVYDELVDEFISSGELQSARDLVYEMQLILADQRPYIPLYSEKVFDFARTNVIFPYVDILGGIESRDGFQNSSQVIVLE